MDNYSYSAETADVARSLNTGLGNSPRSLICPDYNEQNLREKALMYAVQTYGPSLDGLEIVGIAEGYLYFLRGDAK